LLFPFSKFNDLLRFSGAVGEKLQLKVSDKLLSNGEQPYIIDLINDNIIFTNCSLELVHLQDGDSTYFCVEEITPLSFLQQTKNLRTNMRDFHSVELNNDLQQNFTLVEFAQMYFYYKGLIELNISQLYKHPYLGKTKAKNIMAYHNVHGPLNRAKFESMRSLSVPEKQKLLPYLKFTSPE
jgi:hypothetical protein